MWSIWLLAPYASFLLFASFIYFIVYPFAEYIRDPKGLRRYPNMTSFSGMSAIPFMILASRGFRSKELSEMHKKNPVIRTGPNTLSYGDVRAIKDIYGHGTKCIKDPSYIVTAGTHYHLADVIDRAEHSQKRKVLSSAYALKNLETWEYKVTDKLERLVAHFDKVCTAPASDAVVKGKIAPDPQDITLDFRAWTNFFTLDAIADIGLSEKLGFLDTGSDECIAETKDGRTYKVNLRDALYPNAIKQSMILWNYDWYPILNKLVDVIPYFRRMQETGKHWDNIVWRRSIERLRRYEAGEKLDDFFQATMEDKNGRPNNLEWGNVVSEVNIMMNAGSVTTAVAITNVMYQLLKNPHCLAKLREEVDSVLDPDEVIAPYDKVKHLPYLRACLDESMRIFPPTSHGLPRETPAEGLEILGQWVPGKTSVSMSAYVAHHDERAFPNSDQYIPERFMGEQGKAVQPYFVAFSAGARSCIGRNISYLEQTKALASLVHRYDFALPHPDWELKRLESMNLILGDMPVKIWRRELAA
ncbi:cytochrome P450 [Aspergillus ruber CBS 135680]|uniref:Cytochrome P450 monooxygenase n=1 Tax=Aspergillus ruber (strain CBS 135680) TaxID=1388766 RepID=A0A017SK77_ASPRC|nr:cytochrome P450 monooxygenase [Aspergillus ruber CBS 135680]EYE97347.1 cytochrome P450 monooxygenase [Aspergillus ruber CBS 135680]